MGNICMKNSKKSVIQEKIKIIQRQNEQIQETNGIVKSYEKKIYELEVSQKELQDKIKKEKEEDNLALIDYNITNENYQNQLDIVNKMYIKIKNEEDKLYKMHDILNQKQIILEKELKETEEIELSYKLNISELEKLDEDTATQENNLNKLIENNNQSKKILNEERLKLLSEKKNREKDIQDLKNTIKDKLDEANNDKEYTCISNKVDQVSELTKEQKSELKLLERIGRILG